LFFIIFYYDEGINLMASLKKEEAHHFLFDPVPPVS